MSRAITIICTLIFISAYSYSQSVVGIWKNIEKDEIQSHIEVYESDGKLYAKVIELFPTSKVTHCEKCHGDDKGASLMDIFLFRDMVLEDDKWVDGKILDPRSGKEYACHIELKDANTLKIRGYVGNPLFGKTFYWHRVQ
jgi:uncharacterized protein (DUF2147 family)